jgi:hypothetical protein
MTPGNRASDTRPINILVTNDGTDKYSFRLGIGCRNRLLETETGSGARRSSNTNANSKKRDSFQMQRNMKHN